MTGLGVSRALVVAVAAGWLAGCAIFMPPPLPPSPPPPPPPVVIHAPAPPVPAPPPPRASCVPRNFPKAPKYPDTDAALRSAGGAADRYQMLAAGRLARAKRLADLERLVEACR